MHFLNWIEVRFPAHKYFTQTICCILLYVCELWTYHARESVQESSQDNPRLTSSLCLTTSSRGSQYQVVKQVANDSVYAFI